MAGQLRLNPPPELNDRRDVRKKGSKKSVVFLMCIISYVLYDEVMFVFLCV